MTRGAEEEEGAIDAKYNQDANFRRCTCFSFSVNILRSPTGSLGASSDLHATLIGQCVSLCIVCYLLDSVHRLTHVLACFFLVTEQEQEESCVLVVRMELLLVPVIGQSVEWDSVLAVGQCVSPGLFGDGAGAAVGITVSRSQDGFTLNIVKHIL